MKNDASEALTILLKMLITSVGYHIVLGGKYMDTNQAGLQCGCSVAC